MTSLQPRLPAARALRGAALAALLACGVAAAAGAPQAAPHRTAGGPDAAWQQAAGGPDAAAQRTAGAPSGTRAAWPDAAAPSPERQAQLRTLVLQDCGSCHGMRLTGGLGTPLTAQALRDKPAELLTAAVLLGRPGTAMPPWSALLSEADAAWIVARLKEGSFTDGR